MVEVARAESERGELVLRQRTEPDGSTTLELRANGVFVMDTRETSSERALAREALARHAGAGQRAGRRARSRVHARRGAGGPARTPGGRRRDRARAGRVVARRDRPARTRAARRPQGGGPGRRRRRRHRGGRGRLRPGAARRGQRPRVPRPRRQLRPLRPHSAAARPDGRCGRMASASSGPPPTTRPCTTRWPRCSATPRRRRTTSTCRAGPSSTGFTSRGYLRRRERLPSRVPHRARLHGRGPGPAGRPVAGADPAGRRELPDQRSAARAGAHPRAGPHQGGRRAHQRRARVPDRRAGGRHHRGHRCRSSTASTTTSSRSTSSRPARAPAPT